MGHLYLKGGWLTWDDEYAVESELIDQTYVDRYRVGSHHVQRYKPPKSDRFEGNREDPALGYTTHAGRLLFWIAVETLSCGETCTATTSRVYELR